MSDWEIKSLQNQLERLEKRYELQNEKVSKESLNRFIWLMVLSNILFWFCLAQIDLRYDFNFFHPNQQSHNSTKNDSTPINKT